MTFYDFITTRTDGMSAEARDIADEIRGKSLLDTEFPMDILEHFMRKGIDELHRAELRNLWKTYKIFDQIECRVRVALQECRAVCLGVEAYTVSNEDLEALSIACAMSIMEVK